MSQYKLLPSYTDLTSLSLDCGLGGHTAGPVIFSAAVGGDRLLELDPGFQVIMDMELRIVSEYCPHAAHIWCRAHCSVFMRM